MMRFVLTIVVLLFALNWQMPARSQTGGDPADRKAQSKLTAEEIQAAHQRAEAFIHSKSYRRAIEEYQKILAVDPADQRALYNTACMYALLNEKTQAIEFLRKAVEAGWTNIAHMEQDPDLTVIRGETGYKEILQSLTERPTKIKAALEEGAALLAAQRYNEAIAKFREANKLDPNNPDTLYSLARALALGGEPAAALDALDAAFKAGFTAVSRARNDMAFESLRQNERFQSLTKPGVIPAWFANKAQAKVNAAKTELSRSGCDPQRYKTVFDYEHNMVFLSARPDTDLAATRKEFADFADFMWKHLLRKNPAQLLCVVLMTTEDMRKTTKRATGGIGGSGWYTGPTDFLWLGNDPNYDKLRLNLAMHEYTHALVSGDFRARGLGEPERWFTEGMATLFESADRVGDVWVPRDNTVRRNWLSRGTIQPWDTFMSNASTQLFVVVDVKNVQTAYAQCRYMFFYFHQRGLLKKFYDRYTSNLQNRKPKPAREAVEFAFGKPLETVQAEWLKWVKNPDSFRPRPQKQ